MPWEVDDMILLLWLPEAFLLGYVDINSVG